MDTTIDTVTKGAKGAAKIVEDVTEDVATGLKKTTNSLVDAASTIVKTGTKVATDTTADSAETLKGLLKSLPGDDIMQMICVILLGVILIMINPANSAVMLMRKWWVRLIAVVFLVIVLFAERSKPRVSVLLGLVLISLILFSDVPVVQSESFYGRVPQKGGDEEQMSGSSKTYESNQTVEQNYQEPLPMGADSNYAPV
tara:strand:+ start:11315 stop:11911 length:597 start_codon:yes stop_codon:yes gene_type:complete